MTAKKLGILGMGQMGQAIAQGLRVAGGWEISGCTRSEGSASEVVEQSQVLILAVKPSQARALLEQVAPLLRPDQLLISVCAAVQISQLKLWSGGKCKVVRSMPNTPCLVGQGMTVWCAEAGELSAVQTQLVENIFKQVGRVVQIEESQMNGATGLSGCGPAYGYLVIEALSEAGVKVGLSRKTSTLLAAQTLLGAAKMVLERGVHPAALKDEVTTPAGCTIDGLMALEEGKLRVTLIKAVVAASERSSTLKI